MFLLREGAAKRLLFVESVLCKFLSYGNDRVVKTHLIYQKKMMARTSARAARTRSAPIAENPSKMPFSRHVDGARGARGNARACI